MSPFKTCPILSELNAHLNREEAAMIADELQVEREVEIVNSKEELLEVIRGFIDAEKRYFGKEGEQELLIEALAIVFASKLAVAPAWVSELSGELIEMINPSVVLAARQRSLH